jgi:hypothetical protein
MRWWFVSGYHRLPEQALIQVKAGAHAALTFVKAKLAFVITALRSATARRSRGPVLATRRSKITRMSETPLDANRGGQDLLST